MGTALHSRPVFPEPAPQGRVSLRNRILFLAAVWLVALVQLFFWRGTWFGRPLSDQQIGDYLHDKNPRRVQHALIQLGDRMAHKDPTAEAWYPELVVLAVSGDEDIRTTAAQVMDEDPTRPEFHDVLLHMLRDPSMSVRCQAALALVRFDDASGHDQIVGLLDPMVVKTPYTGRVLELPRMGAAIANNAVLVKLDSGGGPIEIRSPVAGRVRGVSVQQNEHVSAGTELLTLTASPDQVWRALRALATIGHPDDLSAVDAYARISHDIPERLRQQATLTDKAIRERASSK
jgi:biotin carboxyl carrier protein